MEDTQSFRLIGTTQIEKIPIQHIDGQSVVYWESIERAFPGVRQVKNDNVAIPCCIKSFPGVVLDVVLSNTTEHVVIDSLVEASIVSSTVAPVTARTVDSTDAPVGEIDAPIDLSTDFPGENDFFNDLQVASASAEMPSDDIRAYPLSTCSSILLPSPHSEVEMTSKTALSSNHIVQLASKNAKASDSQAQLQKLSANMEQMISFQKASDAKQEEIKQLQKQVLEQQEEQQKKILEHHEEIKGLQKQALEKQEKMDRLQIEMSQLQIQNQEELRQMYIEAMGQLVVLQSRVQAVLTQTFELHEYPIPRLFIVLPQDPSGWDTVNPFSNKFRLYFLCECGEHTRLANSKTKIPHHIHLAKHEGYEIARPSEFFQQYGSRVLTILKMLKLGITVAGVAMPALSELISPDVIGQSTDILDELQDNILPMVDQVIEWMDKVTVYDGESIGDISMSNGKSVQRVTEQMETKVALEGADLRELSTFLQDKDGNKVLGNLYRTVTVEGHVKWVCIEHYRENYQETQAKAFQRALDLVGGSFVENTGVVTVKLQSKVLAEQFYVALGKVRSVLELDINLNFECTKTDLEGLENALKTSSVSILRLDHQRFWASFGSILFSKSEQHEVLFRIMKLPNMKLIHIVLSKEFGKLSSFQPKDLFHLQKLSLEMLMTRDNGAESLSEALKINSNLTTLNLNQNKIGDNEAQALSQVLKINSTLTTLSLRWNSIEHSGVQAL
ncbi:hypothetical protein BGZ99_003421, partial [Dissophora globulifera]